MDFMMKIWRRRPGSFISFGA